MQRGAAEGAEGGGGVEFGLGAAAHLTADGEALDGDARRRARRDHAEGDADDARAAPAPRGDVADDGAGRVADLTDHVARARGQSGPPAGGAAPVGGHQSCPPRMPGSSDAFSSSDAFR